MPLGVGENEITRGKHTPVIADPRGDGVIGVLRGAAVELERDARKDPRMVVGIQGIDAETLAVGIGARGIEHGGT